MTTTVYDFFNEDRPMGDFVVRYEGWEAPLTDGTKLTGCILNYIVVQRLGAAYCELYLNVSEPSRCAAIVRGLLEPFVADPQFLLPKSMRENEIRFRRNEQDVREKLNQLPVMPRFTIYTLARLELPVKEALVDTWRVKGVELKIIDQSYVESHERKLRPHAFISHSFEDKETIAKPLAEGLRKQLGTIWYDEYSLRVGDSLRESIEEGLKRSDHCILILSKAFLKNVGWAKREFDSIYAREIVEKRKAMLPIWVDVSLDNVYEYSPILADRFAVNWSEGLNKVLEKLATALRHRSVHE